VRAIAGLQRGFNDGSAKTAADPSLQQAQQIARELVGGPATGLGLKRAGAQRRAEAQLTSRAPRHPDAASLAQIRLPVSRPSELSPAGLRRSLAAWMVEGTDRAPSDALVITVSNTALRAANWGPSRRPSWSAKISPPL